MAAFVPGSIKSCLEHLFVLGTNWLQQSVNGPAAAAFVPGLNGSCIVQPFVLGTNWLPAAICKGAWCCCFCPRFNQDLHKTSICFGDRTR